jgi:hypothetical protein
MAAPIIIRMARLEHLTALGYRPHRRTNDYPQRLTAAPYRFRLSTTSPHQPYSALPADKSTNHRPCIPLFECPFAPTYTPSSSTRTMTIMTLQPTVYGAYAETDPRRTTFLLSSLQLRLVIAVIAGTTNTDSRLGFKE